MALLNLLLAVSLGFTLLPVNTQAEAGVALAPGDSALVLGTGGSGLKIRSGPGLSHNVRGVASEGALVSILQGPTANDDQFWFQVRWTDGTGTLTRGWAAGTYLVAADRIETREDGAFGTRDFIAKVSGYASGGSIGYYTSTGTRVHWGTVATDPSYVPFGSLLLIEDLEGVFVAEDSGPAVKGATVDVWFPDRQAAVRFGTQRKKVTVLREGY